MRCEVADESVVVMKFRPVKPGNSVEDKTQKTRKETGTGRDPRTENPPLDDGQHTSERGVLQRTESKPGRSMRVDAIVGSRGRKVTVRASGNRDRGTHKRVQKTGRGCPNPVKGYRRDRHLKGYEESGSRPEGPSEPR